MQGPKVLQEAMGYLVALAGEGKIGPFEPVLLDPHGGDLTGFVMVKGTHEQIGDLKRSEQFLKIVAKIQLVHSCVRVVDAYAGEELETIFSAWDQAKKELLS